MRLMRLALPLLAALPLYAAADACDTVALFGGNPASCRANAAASGATIHDNWMTNKPILADNYTTGKSGMFWSTGTPATSYIGLKPKSFKFLNLGCFDGKRQFRLDETANVTMLTLKDKEMTFKVDNQPAFSETWELRPSEKTHYAPESSVLSSKLRGAKKLVVTWQYNKGQPPSGYTFSVSGFNQASAALCK